MSLDTFYGVFSCARNVAKGGVLSARNTLSKSIPKRASSRAHAPILSVPQRWISIVLKPKECPHHHSRRMSARVFITEVAAFRSSPLTHTAQVACVWAFSSPPPAVARSRPQSLAVALLQELPVPHLRRRSHSVIRLVSVESSSAPTCHCAKKEPPSERASVSGCVSRAKQDLSTLVQTPIGFFFSSTVARCCSLHCTATQDSGRRPTHSFRLRTRTTPDDNNNNPTSE